METEDNQRSEEYISGIYNYCDRWCDRCPFTSRCQNYAASEKTFGDQASRDLDNAAFWDRLTGVLERSLKLVEQPAADLGVDLSRVELPQDDPRTTPLPETHDLSLAAAAYAESVSRWLESAGGPLDSKKDELNMQASLDLPVSTLTVCEGDTPPS